MLFKNCWGSVGCWWTCTYLSFDIYQSTLAQNCLQSHKNCWFPDFFFLKVLPDVRSEVHLVRRNIVSTGQTVRALRKYIFRLVEWISSSVEFQAWTCNVKKKRTLLQLFSYKLDKILNTCEGLSLCGGILVNYSWGFSKSFRTLLDWSFWTDRNLVWQFLLQFNIFYPLRQSWRNMRCRSLS